jgi:hypothetical protein
MVAPSSFPSRWVRIFVVFFALAGLLVLAPLALATPELGRTRIGSLCSPAEMRRGTAKFDWEG